MRDLIGLRNTPLRDSGEGEPGDILILKEDLSVVGEMTLRSD
jgi:hypothetical protein